MKRSTRKMLGILVPIFLIVVLVAALEQPGLGQPPPQAKTATQAPAGEQWLSVMVIRVKPDMLTEWLDFHKKEVLPAQKKGGVKWCNVWQAAAFGESYEFVLVTPIEKFAQFDGPNPIQKALGEEGYRAFSKKARQLVTGLHTYATRLVPELSYNGKMTGPPKLIAVHSIHVAPGRATEYDRFVKDDILPVMKKAGVPGFWMHRTVFGGDVNEYVAVVAYNSFADLDKGSPLVQVLGAEGAAKLVQKSAGLSMKHENGIYRLNSELSFGASGEGPGN